MTPQSLADPFNQFIAGLSLNQQTIICLATSHGLMNNLLRRGLGDIPDEAPYIVPPNLLSYPTELGAHLIKDVPVPAGGELADDAALSYFKTEEGGRLLQGVLGLDGNPVKYLVFLGAPKFSVGVPNHFETRGTLQKSAELEFWKQIDMRKVPLMDPGCYILTLTLNPEVARFLDGLRT